MEQKRPAPRLALWLLVGLLAAVTAQASSISLKRSGSYRGCVAACAPKDNSIYQSSSSSGLTSLWRRSQQEAYPASAHFEPGKTYTYRVHTWTAALASFATEQQGQQGEEQDYQPNGERLAELQATAWITPLSECEVSMQLKDIQLTAAQYHFEEEEKAAFIEQLKNPILFGYSHGVVTEVCTDEADQDQTEVLNLKKSIISALQTIPTLAEHGNNAYPVKVIESDVNGDCQTEYTVSKQPGSSGKYLIEKEKNLATGCENAPRQQAMYSSWKNALLSHSAHQKAFCVQTVDHRQVIAAQCQSAHTINAPGLAHMDLDVIANVELVAEEVFETSADADESKSAQVPEQWRRHAPRLMMSSPIAESRIFKLSSKDGKMKKGYRHQQNQQIIDGRVQLKSVLEEICEDMVAHGRRPTTKTVRLVQTLAEVLAHQASHQDVAFVWKSIVQAGKVCGGQEAKKLQDIFVDTAASVMNGPSAAVVRDELIRYIDRAAETKDALYSQRARYLAVVASFATEPTPEAIRQLLPELLEKVEDTHVILSLTALLKKTNSISNSGEQQMDAAFIESLYQTVLRKVTELLSRKGANAEADIVRLLTALENIDARAAPVAGQERLVKISTDKRLPLSVRVAAIKSAEHIEMIPALRQTMLALFGDRAEANECRLAAYRTLMHSSITVQELAHIRRVVLEQEKSNADVANYVCSHQKNLRSSEDARKRELLPAGAPLFPEPQSLANIALSRNFEYSSINEKTQVGAIIEADLIMEAESRVPRSITFNLTVPVAEQQIPVIEVTVRQAGLEEAVIRRLQALRDIKSPAHALRELGSLVRMAKKSGKKQQKYQEEEDKDEQESKKKKVQIFINIDGKNVFLWDSVQCGEEHGNAISRNGGEFETVLEQLYKRLPISLDETMVVMPLKHRVRLPTASGIPVTFQLNTTLIVSYEAQLKGVQSGAERRLEAHIKPTFVVETGVGLVADLPYGQPQQRVAIINRQVSSPTFHVKTSYKADSRQFKAKFLLPESEQIIARYETEFIQTADAMEQQQQQLKKSKKSSSASGANADEIFQALNKQMRRAFEKRRAAKNARAGGVFYRSGKSAEVCMPALEQLTGFTYCVQHFDVEDLKESFLNADEAAGKPKLVYLSQVKLVKTDRAMEGLEFGLQLPAQLYAPEATSDEVKFVLHYDTPGSTANRRLNAELMVRLPQSAAEHFIVRVDVDSPLKKFAGQIRLQNDRHQKGIKIELTTDRAERQFLFEANAIFNVQKEEKSDRQIKLQLRLQPTAKSSMSTFEGDFAIAHQTSSSNKQKVTAKLTANEKKVLEIAFVKAGQLISLEQDCKASLTFVLDLFGAQLQYNSMLNKVAATGTIKSTGELKYNRFLAFSRRVRDQVESIGYQVQFTGFNLRRQQQEQEIKKIFLHWALQSTQFPSLKQELTYNIKVGKEIAEQFEQELLFKWSTGAPEEKRIRFAQELKQLANSRTREQKLQATAELEITPFAYHHEAKFVVDMPNKEQENSRPTLTAELKATNRKTGQTTVEARWMHSILSAQPLKAVYEGDLALGADRWFVHSVRNSMEETKAKHYEGKASFGLKVKNDHYWLPNLDQKVALRYNFQLRSSPADRVPVIAAAKVPGSHIWNLYARIINTVDRFENEMDVEDAYFGRYHQKSSVVCSAEETCTSQWAVERPGGKLVYKGETERNLVAKTLRFKLEAGEEYLSAFGIEVTTQLTDRIKSIDVKVANRRFAHQTRILADRAEQKLEIRCQTKKDQQVTFELDAKSVEYFKVAQLKLKSELIEADIDLANLQTPALIRKGLAKRALFRTLFLERYPAEDSTIKVEIRLPRAELEHRVNVRAAMKTARQIEYSAETRHHGRNLLKVKVHLQPEGQESVAVSAEYKNGYTAELKLVKPDQSDAHQHQLEVNYRVAPKQIFHKSVARWAFNAEKEMPLFGGSLYRLPYHFRLITLDTKSHLGQEAIFDLAYRCNEANPSAEYAHELLFSGRQSHAELKLSRFGFDYDNARYAPKAFFTLKSKSLFGGSLEHTTELKDVSVERRQLTITSKTARRGESIAEVEARIIYQTGQQSTIKVQLPAAGRQLTAQLVPFTSLEVHCNLIGDAAWRHTARLERSAERRQWSVKVNSKNERKEGEKWNAQLSHQCDQHTTLELESPIVRGLIEVQIPARKLRIDLKGDSARYSNSNWWAAYEHRFEGQIDKQAKKLTIRSTTSKQAKTIAFIDAELYAPFSSEEARASTLKLELEQPIIKKSELAPFKLAITVDPKAAAWELTAAAGNKWKHECSVKRIAPKTISIHSETRKHGQTIARLEVSELSAKKAVFHAQAEPEKVFGGISSQWVPSSLKSATPFDVKGTIDLEEREVAFQAHAKRSDRLVKFEAKAKKDTTAAHLKNVHIECSWDAKRAPQKRALVQVRIQDRASAPERLVATIRGDLIDRPFNVAIDVPRRASEMFRSRSASFSIEAEMKSQSGGEPMIAKISRAVQPQTGDCRSAIELRKGDFVVVKAEAKVTGFAKKSLSSSSSSVQKKHLSMKVQSDLKSAPIAAALLNAEIEMSRECTYQQCQTKASAEYGTAAAAEQKKSIKFEGANVADALRGQLVINAGRRMLQQTVKFEFIKPESKLQINVFNQAGRQVDLNVDLARPLQKKFQIVSFVEAIPTVDIEAAYGENSRLVLQVSFQEEKKLELALNWFGQWRRDFKLEALFKCFSSPALEMVVTSRHPAGVDEIEGMLKVAGKEWAAKLSRTFDESRANWNTRTLIKANGVKKVELVVECATRGGEQQSKRLVKTYKVHLDGVRQATGHVTVHLRQPSGIVEMIQVEGGKDAQHPRQATLELFFGHHDHQTSKKTGVKVTIEEKAFFGLVHITNDAANAGNKRTSMVRLELPEEIEYVLRNEIEYEHQKQKQIKSIRSELKKRSQPVPIYQTVITFEEADQQMTDMKVMRIEVRSSSFAEAPKQMVIRYNFRPKVCHSVETLQPQSEQLSSNSFANYANYEQYEQAQQQEKKKMDQAKKMMKKGEKKSSFPYGEAKCWRVELIAGDLVNGNGNQANSQQQNEGAGIVRIAAEYIKAPVAGSFHYNRTVAFRMESSKPAQQHRSINCQLIGHVSPKSFGIVWANQNRHGQQKTGMIYADKQKQQQQQEEMINIYVREQNAHQPSKDFVGEVHFSPAHIRKTLSIGAKFDQAKLRRWLVGELPTLHEMVKDESSVGSLRKKMARALKEELAHKMATLKEAYDAELAQPLMAEAAAVGEQLKASEDQLMAEIVEVVKRADFSQQIEKLLAMIDLERALDEAERSLAEGWQAMEAKVQAAVESGCQKSDRCRKMINRIRDYEIRRFLKATFEEKVKKVSSAIKRVLPEDLMQLAKEFQAAHAYEVNEEDDDDEASIYRAQNVDSDSDSSEAPVAYRRAMIIKHGARLLKMAQPELTKTVMKHLNHMAQHFDYDEDAQDDQDQDDFQLLKKKKNVDWTEVRGDIYDMAADIIEQQAKKAEESKKHQEQEEENAAAPWSIWTSGFGNGSSSGSANNYQDYSKYASKWGKQQQQQEKKNKLQKEKSGYYGFDSVDEPEVDDEDDREEFRRKWSFSPKRGEFFYGGAAQQPQMQAAY